MKIDSSVLNELALSWMEKTNHPFETVAVETDETQLSDAEEKGRDLAIKECVDELESVLNIFKR